MKDLLGRKIYADKIADEIIGHYSSQKKAVLDGEKEDRENIIFAISGKWGEGKTQLLGFIEKPLKEAGFKIVHFNPWQYSQEDITLKRAFLKIVNKDLDSQVDLEDLYFDQTRTTISWKSLPWSSIIWWFLSSSLFTFIFIPHYWIKNVFHELWSSGIVTVITTLVFIPILVKTILLNKRAGNVSTAEEFEDKFEEILKNKERVTIFIDDLDRCNPRTVKTILDSLRTFFQHPECSYIITGDHTVIERYAAQELEMDDDADDKEKSKEGRRFLKKLFDVYWRLPLPTPHQFGFFAETELKNSSVTLNDTQLLNLKSFLTDDDLFERNPRHVKRFITKLRFAIESIKLQLSVLEKENGDDLVNQKKSLREILANPDLLAKILLIEDIFYPAYEKLIIHPEDLVKNEKSLRDNVDLSQMSIHGEKVLDIFGKLVDVERYVALVNRQPKFTDENNSTIHEVANYFYFSGSTGLPTSSGPDESKFVEYIKTGQAVSKLGKVLEESTKENNKRLAESALSLFDKIIVSKEPDAATVPIVIMSESLKFAGVSNEWADSLKDWRTRLDALTSTKTELEDLFILAALKKKPELLDSADKNNVWDVVDQLEEPIAEITLEKLEEIAKNMLPQGAGLRGVEYLINHHNTAMPDFIRTQLTSLELCKDYIIKLKDLKLENGKTFAIVKNALRSLIEKVPDLDWVVVNRELLKQLQIFDGIREHIVHQSNDTDILQKAVALAATLEFTNDEIKKICNNIIQTVRTAKLSFLSDSNIQAFLQKDLKVEVFGVVSMIFKDPKNDFAKRKEAGTVLLKSNALWSNVTLDDIYLVLKDINKTSLQRNQELTSIRRDILASWGYEDVTKSV